MSHIEKKYQLLVMSKSPELGQVKNRMQPALSQAQSVELHTALTRHCLAQWQQSVLTDMSLWVGGDIPLFITTIATALDRPIDIQPQISGDLGVRMSYAVAQCMDKSDRQSELPPCVGAVVGENGVENVGANGRVKGALVVGTDCPSMNAAYIDEAAQALTSHQVVMIPALDGGYVLLGMNAYYPQLFEQIEWGTDKVFQQTCERITALGLTVKVLTALPDIDTPDDLSLLATIDGFHSLSFIGNP